MQAGGHDELAASWAARAGSSQGRPPSPRTSGCAGRVFSATAAGQCWCIGTGVVALLLLNFIAAWAGLWIAGYAPVPGFVSLIGARPRSHTWEEVMDPTKPGLGVAVDAFAFVNAMVQGDSE